MGQGRSQLPRGSRTAYPALSGACQCMAAHELRLPRLTLKAGRKAGRKAGSPRDRRASNRNEMQKSKFAKSKFQKLQTRKNQNLQNFHHNFFREIGPEIICWRSHSCSYDRRQDIRFFVSLCSIGNVRGANLMRASSVPMKRRHLPG